MSKFYIFLLFFIPLSSQSQKAGIEASNLTTGFSQTSPTHKDYIRGDAPIVPQVPTVNPSSEIHFRPSTSVDTLNQGARNVEASGQKNNRSEIKQKH